MIDYNEKIDRLYVSANEVEESYANIKKKFDILKEDLRNEEKNSLDLIKGLGEISDATGKLVENVGNLCKESVEVAVEIVSESVESGIETVQNTVSEGVDEAQSAVNEAVSEANEELDKAKAKMEIVLQKINKIVLEIKRFALTIKLNILKAQKKAIEKFTSKMESPETKAELTLLMTQLQAIATAISVILDTLKSFLQILSSIGSVDAGAMLLVMTPKSMQNITLMPTNAFQDICDKLAEMIYEEITKACEKITLANTEAKNAAIMTAAANGLTLIMSNGLPVIADSVKMLASGDEKIYKTIEGIIDAFTAPEPLPKYEKVSLINPSFMIWLMTSFEPAVHSAFGMPGMP